MSNNLVLIVALLGQVFIISYLYPRKVLGRVKAVVAQYPPHSYGKLYPVDEHEMQRAQDYYKYSNQLIMLLGVVLVIYSFIRPSSELLGWDSQSVLMFYFLLQMTPMIFVLLNPGFSFFNLARMPSCESTRKAEFTRRRLLDFISPGVLVLAGVTYAGFVGFVLVRPDLWGAGYWNILYISLLNLFFAGMVAYHLYGRKLDPHQSHESRLRQINIGIKVSVFASIAATVFLVINVALQNNAGGMQDVVTSLYFQLTVLSTLWSMRIDNVDFEVYKETTGVNARLQETSRSRSGLPAFLGAVSAITFVFIFIFWHARDDQERVDVSAVSSISKVSVVINQEHGQ